MICCFPQREGGVLQSVVLPEHFYKDLPAEELKEKRPEKESIIREEICSFLGSLFHVRDSKLGKLERKNFLFHDIVDEHEHGYPQSYKDGESK